MNQTVFRKMKMKMRENREGRASRMNVDQDQLVVFGYVIAFFKGLVLCVLNDMI